MLFFIAKRLVGVVITLFVIITLSFLIIRITPGSPFSQERDVPVEVLEALKAKYGFDKPLHKQYFQYIGNVVKGDLGLSIKYSNRTVNEIIKISLPKTMQIGFLALIWAILVGFVGGAIAAVKQNTKWDYGLMSIAMCGISIPPLVSGPLLILVFALALPWFPTSGWGSWKHVVLPSISLGSVYAAYIARLTRGGMLEVIRSNYIRTARAKGLSEKAVVVKHALKGGILPVVTFLGPAVASIMVGSVVVEKIFNTPGMGPYFVDAAFNRDYFLLMGVVIVYAVFLLLLNLLVDIAYGFIDPRIRFE
ncbi:MAG: ABC transporter permease subunit [Bdellovibrionales bacterium]|nr:ABC transporter permease subunit [Bdellovibrionales bacterium]